MKKKKSYEKSDMTQSLVILYNQYDYLSQLELKMMDIYNMVERWVRDRNITGAKPIYF